MMGTRSQALQKLQAYVKEVKETEYTTSSTSERKTYNTQLEATFEELLERVKAETVTLEQVDFVLHVVIYQTLIACSA